eukprot:1357042-Amphidinium_carterae.1
MGDSSRESNSGWKRYVLHLHDVIIAKPVCDGCCGGECVAVHCQAYAHPGRKPYVKSKQMVKYQ